MSLELSKENLILFEKIFGSSDHPIRHFIAPARINIIGEHVDYLGGTVLPAAIDFYVNAIIRPKDGSEIGLYSVTYQKKINANRPFHQFKEANWADYILGVIVEIEKMGKLVPGFDLLIEGNIPQGSGLSSSAALEVVVGFALNEVFELGLSKKEIALIGQRAENNFVGTKCGIMDQFIIAHGRENDCISLNTDSLDFKYHHFNLGNYEFYLINSNVKHSLKDSAYNTRRSECESALRKIQSKFPNFTQLYDVTLSQLELEGLGLTNHELKRTKHVISERERTKSVILALEAGDFSTVGKGLYETHWSLSQDFEVSCEETDFIVENLQKWGTWGARMIGGGFGGCILVLDEMKNFSSTSDKIKKSYQQKFGLPIDFYKFHISDGVKEVTR